MTRIWPYGRGNFPKKTYLGVIDIKGCEWVHMAHDGCRWVQKGACAQDQRKTRQ